MFAVDAIIFGCDTLQVRARTSAGYGAFSRRFEFQTSPYCEYTREREHDRTIKFNMRVTHTCNSRCQVCFLCVPNPTFSSAVTATSERAQASIVVVAITLALVLLAVVAGFLLSGR